MGRNDAILISTATTSDFSLLIISNLCETNNRFININMFPPSTATLFGVTPHSIIRKLIADNAILFIMMVKIESPNNNNKLNLLLEVLLVSATENNINDDKKINECNKLIQTCETILDRTHKNIELINDKLQCSCCHKFIKDTIDVTPEYSMNITYCELCDLTL